MRDTVMEQWKDCYPSTVRRENSLQRAEKYRSVRLRCTKARNEYILCVKAANASLHKVSEKMMINDDNPFIQFYADDLSFLIDCADLGMDFWLQSLIG